MTEEDKAKERLRVELERLSRMAALRRSTQAHGTTQEVPAETSTSAGRNGGTAEPEGAGRPDEHILREQLARTVKVSWREPAPGSGDGYSTDQLRKAFARHGRVEDVVLRDSGRKKKGSALVVLDSREAVERALSAVNGSMDNPLLCVPASKTPPPVGLAGGAAPGAADRPAGGGSPGCLGGDFTPGATPSRPLFAAGSATAATSGGGAASAVGGFSFSMPGAATAATSGGGAASAVGGFSFSMPGSGTAAGAGIGGGKASFAPGVAAADAARRAEERARLLREAEGEDAEDD